MIFDAAVEGQYDAAMSAAAVFDRNHRTRILVTGRAPGQMLNGILTGTIPGVPVIGPDAIAGGRSTYHAVLTPKGKMVTDLWAYRLGQDGVESFLLDVPRSGGRALKETLVKVLPPRLATTEDVSARTGMLTVVGPDAGRHVASVVLDGSLNHGDLAELGEAEWRAVGIPSEKSLIVGRSNHLATGGFDVLGPAGDILRVWRSLVDEGVCPAGHAAWTTLRVEGGRPSFGSDMTDATIPIEAGIHDRAIDYQKGCYTGQEVIIRIRDRGKVNRSLRLIHFGQIEPPKKGTQLFVRGPDGHPEGKPIGWVTTAVHSPRHGQIIGLGYVRTGIDEKEVVPG